MEGFVMPSWMSATNSGEYFDAFLHNNFALKVGQVLSMRYPEETKQATHADGYIPILYDVIVNETTSRGRIQTIYQSCQLIKEFGSAADYFEYTLRPNDQLTPAGGSAPDLISTKLSDIKNLDTTKLQGAQVLLLCLDGNPANAFIIGAIDNYLLPVLNSKDNKKPSGDKFLNPYVTPTKSDGYFLKWSFNGMYVFVNKDGEFLVQRYGPTNSDGSAVSADDADKGTSIQLDKLGNINIQTQIKDGKPVNTFVLNNDGSVVISTALDDNGKATNTLTINKDCSMTIAVNGGKTIAIANKDSDATLTLGGGDKSVAIAESLKTLYGNLKSYVENAIVPTGMGPSGTILAGSGPAPSWDDSIVSKSMKLPK